mmetsp:Transcript_85022/g.245537  ORF Transcript_85022/g.245537 Transcript_85022/m.245537 type:complete len:137 (-) Transcript_85022:383-793(-)
MGNACCNNTEDGTVAAVAVRRTADVATAPQLPLQSAGATEVGRSIAENDGALILLFRDEGLDMNHTATFTATPVGIHFSKTTPIRVKSVAPGSLADNAGVQKGMVLLEVNGADVEHSPVAEIQHLLASWGKRRAAS